MDIVDAQIHIGPGGIAEAVAGMDGIGISAALIDEYWLRNFANEPHNVLPGGTQRPIAPTAELAAQMHPTRFSYLLRIDRQDPDHAFIIRQMRDSPYGRALRIDPGLTPATRALFGDGGYDHITAAASENGLPLFIFCPDSPQAFARLARKFPDLRIGIDHCGLYSNSMRASFGELPERDEAGQLALFDEVLALAEYPNVALKWGHASAMFDIPAWPGGGLQPLLRRAISAFGAERVMWASDFSVNQRGESWADLLFSVKANFDISEQERAAVLGGSLRSWLNWPV